MNSREPSTEVTSRPSESVVHIAARFVQLLRRRKIILIAAIGVFGFLGGIYYMTATRIYEARASLLVLQSGSEVWGTSMSDETKQRSLIPTYVRLFHSEVVLAGAIQRLQAQPPQLRVDFVSSPKRQWSNILRNNLNVRGINETNLIELSYRSKEPETAEAVLSALVASYLDFMEKNHRDVAVEIVTILDKERNEIEERLTQKQQRLLDVKRKVRDLGIREGTNVVHPVVQRAVLLNQELTDIQKSRIQLEAATQALRKSIGVGGDIRQHLMLIEPEIGKDLILKEFGLDPRAAELVERLNSRIVEDQAKLNTLLRFYGNSHPQVIELRENIKGVQTQVATYQRETQQQLASLKVEQLGPTLLSLLEEKLRKTVAHEKQLQTNYSDAEAEAVKLNDRMGELTVVEHDLRLLRNLHDTLLNRIANIDIGQNQADVRVTVVSDPNAPESPVDPRLSRIAMFCLFGGFAVGASIIYAIDLLDDRFRSPEDLSEQLAMPVLALVRKLPESDATGADALQVHLSPNSVESEAFRTLRTTLTFSAKGKDCLVVTSAEPGDGKTTVLSNLGASFAQVGRRTLLIDADMRRPGMSKLFDLKGLLGLSTILQSDRDISEICPELILDSGIENLDLIPCGPKPSNPTELLSGPRLSELIAWAQSNYDQVLIDSSPVAATSEAAIIGQLVDGVILVVSPEKNHRRLVLRAAEGLLSFDLQLLGVVANRIDPSKESGYGDYGYGYGYGYGEEDEPHDESGELAVSTLPMTRSDQPSSDDDQHEQNQTIRRRSA